MIFTADVHLYSTKIFVSDIAVFVLKSDVKLQPTINKNFVWRPFGSDADDLPLELPLVGRG